MASGGDWWRHSAINVLWILTLILTESTGKKTQVFYMDAGDCNNRKSLGSAVVYSHAPSRGDYYPHDTECHLVFQAERADWRLMMTMMEMDIPDRTENGYCNDALYVYDDETILTKAMEAAGGTGGLCGSVLPSTLNSTGQFMRVVFKTDSDGLAGRGFKFIITAFTDDLHTEGSPSCQTHHNFRCANSLCIDLDLVCDGVDTCGDQSDEGADSCRQECAFICQFLSLGITASIFISVASIVVIISCLVAVVCCCRRSACRKSPDPTTYTGTNVVTTATTVSVNGGSAGAAGGGGSGGGLGSGAPSSANGTSVNSYQMVSRAPSAFSNHGYAHQGYHAMQPVGYPPPHPHPHPYPQPPQPVIYAYDPAFVALPASQYSSHSASQYSNHTPSVSQYSTHTPSASQYSSHAPSSHTRPYTPTSSKSGKSNRSNNSTSVTYSQGTEKVSLPVNL